MISKPKVLDMIILFFLIPTLMYFALQLDFNLFWEERIFLGLIVPAFLFFVLMLAWSWRHSTANDKNWKKFHELCDNDEEFKEFIDYLWKKFSPSYEQKSKILLHPYAIYILEKYENNKDRILEDARMEKENEI